MRQAPESADNSGVGEERSDGYLERAGGVRLYYCNWLPAARDPDGAARPLLIVMHGYAEHCRRYDELAAVLVQRQIGVCRFDARGHGRSSGQRGYVRAFDEYVDDLTAFVARVAESHPGRPLALLGHSNGGLIAIAAVQRGLPLVRALALTSPLLALPRARRPVPDGVARLLSAVLGRLPLPNGIRAQDLTHDAVLRAAHDSDRWVFRSATPRWYWSSTLAGRAALRDAASVTLPLLTVIGERDPVVDTAAAKAFHQLASSRDKQLIERPGELHEVLNESARVELMVRIAEWLTRVCAAPEPLAAQRFKSGVDRSLP